ncbi:hypothetical protein PS1_019326 [Malus domestica]
MASPFNICLDLSLGSDAGVPHQGDIWRPSFISSNGPLTVEDSVMRDATTATVVAMNLLTPRDNRLLSRRSDELAVQDSLTFSVQCAGSVSNMGQRLLARTCQVESLTAEVKSLRREIKHLKRENRELRILANDYSTSMKRKLDHLQAFEGRIQSDHQKFVAFFQRHLLPSLSGVRLIIEAPHDQSLVPSSSRVQPRAEASREQPL